MRNKGCPGPNLFPSVAWALGLPAATNPVAPGMARNRQNRPGLARSCQQGIAKSCREPPGAARSCQGVAKRCQELPGSWELGVGNWELGAGNLKLQTIGGHGRVPRPRFRVIYIVELDQLLKAVRCSSLSVPQSRSLTYSSEPQSVATEVASLTGSRERRLTPSLCLGFRV